MEENVDPSHLLGVGDCGLHRRTPYGMTNVSMTQLCIARHCGGCTYQGDSYTYLPHTDELIRDDVLKWKRKQDRKRETADRERQRLFRKMNDAWKVADKEVSKAIEIEEQFSKADDALQAEMSLRSDNNVLERNQD